MEEVVYLNGSLVPRSQARISPFDHGFLYGYGLFETMRAYNGKIFLLERHIRRLLESAEIIGLVSALDGDMLQNACTGTLEANGLADARVRLTVSRGESNGFPGPFVAESPTVIATANLYTPPSPDRYNKGFIALLSSFTRCSHSLLPRLKSANYLMKLRSDQATD